MPLIKWIDKLLDWVAIAALMLMLSLVSIQVFYRYVLKDPIGYAQEISIYSMMLFVMIGMAKAFHHNEHIAVTYFVDHMPRFLSRISAVVTGIIVLCFQTTMAYQCWLLAQRAMRQISPTTGVPVGYVVMFLCVGFALSTIYLLASYLRTFRNYSHNKNLNQHLDDDSSIRKEQF